MNPEIKTKQIKPTDDSTSPKLDNMPGGSMRWSVVSIDYFARLVAYLHATPTGCTPIYENR